MEEYPEKVQRLNPSEGEKRPIEPSMTAIPNDILLPPIQKAEAAALTTEQFAEITTAQARSKMVRRAIKVAAIDAWTSSIFAALGLATSIFSPMGLLVGAGFAAVAFQSFRGLYQLKRLELRGPRTLAVNQLLLAALVTAYSAYSIWDAIHNAGKNDDPLMQEPAVKQMMGDMGPLLTEVTVALYAAVIAGTMVFQGLTAWYYESRKKHLAAYLRDTPAWVVKLQKNQAGP